MKVNEIIANLQKAGFVEARAFQIVNINTDGGWLQGKYIGIVPMTIEGEERENHKFLVVKGEGLLAKGDEKLGKIAENTEVVIFGSGLLNYLLKGKEGQTLAVVYKGMDEFKNKKGKMVEGHQHEVMALAPAVAK